MFLKYFILISFFFPVIHNKCVSVKDAPTTIMLNRGYNTTHNKNQIICDSWFKCPSSLICSWPKGGMLTSPKCYSISTGGRYIYCSHVELRFNGCSGPQDTLEYNNGSIYAKVTPLVSDPIMSLMFLVCMVIASCVADLSKKTGNRRGSVDRLYQN